MKTADLVEIIKFLKETFPGIERITSYARSKTAAKKTPYKCSTCGAVTTTKGHLCTPVVMDKSYSCDYCGKTVGNPRHVCKPKAVKMAFYCDGCGRTAAKKSEVCSPKKI